MRGLRQAIPVGLALAGLLLAASACGGGGAGTGAGSTPQAVLHVPTPSSGAAPTMPVPRQPGQSRFDSYDLRGASDAEFAQYALEWARRQLRPLHTPSLLLARAVSYEEMPQLGLGCPPLLMTVEEPPVMVAILRGEFDFRGAGPGFRYARAPVTGKEAYVYYVFDVWAGAPVITISSENGAPFRQALHDATLPDEPGALLSAVCATPLPSAQRQRHYGDFAPGIPPPTAVPAGSVPTLAPTMPPPVGTWEPAALTPAAKP